MIVKVKKDETANKITSMTFCPGDLPEEGAKKFKLKPLPTSRETYKILRNIRYRNLPYCPNCMVVLGTKVAMKHEHRAQDGMWWDIWYCDTCNAYAAYYNGFNGDMLVEDYLEGGVDVTFRRF
jgi:hypothetical protein